MATPLLHHSAFANHKTCLVDSVSARVGERTARNAALDSLADRTASALVHRVGHVGVFYRRRSEMPKILIPDQ